MAETGPLAAWPVLGGTLAEADIFHWHCHDPNATQSFAETYVRRLEAMRRADAGMQRNPDGNWTIAAHHLERAARYDEHGVRDRPVAIETVLLQPLARLERAKATTWFDR